MVGMHSSGPHKPDRNTPMSLLLGENLPAFTKVFLLSIYRNRNCLPKKVLIEDSNEAAATNRIECIWSKLSSSTFSPCKDAYTKVQTC